MNQATEPVFKFDDLMRCTRVLLNSPCLGEHEFLRYVNIVDVFVDKYSEVASENKRLKKDLDGSIKDISVLDSKLSSARRWLDSERQQRKKVENERDSMRIIFEELGRLLLKDSHKLPPETRERLSAINKTVHDSNVHRTPYDRLNTITELESTASNLSDVSISRSEDDLDETNTRSTRKHRPSYLDDEPVTMKKRKSCTFTPSAPRAESIESLEDIGEKYKTEYTHGHTPAIERLNARTHSFISGTVKIKAECCLPCEKKIRFGTFLKCTDCHAVAHPSCRDRVPLPCVSMGTPSKSGEKGTISDYAPQVTPMIPAIVIHCINEIEQRGLKEVGIYRIPGSDKEVRSLRDQFLKCKGAPKLSETDVEDIHVICCCLKDFLRNLKDLLIPQAEWNAFAEAIFDSDKTNKLHQLISTLPQANRDTLAFLILHLQRVAASPACKMPISNLAAIFGPTVVGPFNPSREDAFAKAQIASSVMEELLQLSPDYWSSFIVERPVVPKTPSTLRNTPSTESLMRKLTTPRNRKRFFNTPPTKRDSDS